MSVVQIEPGSFRDRHNRVFYKDGNVMRALSALSLSEWKALEKTRFFPRLMEEGLILRTRRIDVELEPGEVLPGEWTGFLCHEKIPFISYPYEWSFQMLKDAALLQLQLLSEALAEGMILKDSSPYNIQWKGGKPTFIDLPSFHRLLPGEVWVGYEQFCCLYLYPLLLQAYRNLPFQPWLRGCLEGISPRECRDILSSWDLLRPGVLLHVWLQSRFQERFGSRPGNARKILKRAGFNRKVIVSNIQGLSKLVKRLNWTASNSHWSDYIENNSYSRPDHEAKNEFVRWAVGRKKWDMVWDLGANTGHYSCLAAAGSNQVIAMDQDPASIDLLYRSLSEKGHTNILPLVVNLADPSPDQGWQLMERKALIQRGSPELILCLAMIHHMVIGSNIPMAEFIQWLSSIGGSLVIEFVKRTDPMVELLLRNKEDQYTDYQVEYFEACLKKNFRVQKSQELPSQSRILYMAES